MSRLLDLHIHPAMKMYYLPYLKANFHASIYAGKHFNPLSFRTQYSNLKKSPEKVMLVAHYVIEKNFISKGFNKFARAISWTFAPLFIRKLTNTDPWESLLGQMDTLEKSVDNTNRWVFGDGKKLKLVRRFSEIAELEDNEVAVIHSIEGSHALGYAPEKDETLEEFWEKTVRRLEYLKGRGVSLITPSHFWDNMFAPQTCGTEIVPKKRKGKIVAAPDDALFHMKRGEWHWDDPDHLSERFIKKLLELGILVDVAHTQQQARWRIYDLCEKYNRPVIASHVGLQHFFNHEYNMSDEEIIRIRELGGVVGLILSRRWLVDPITRHHTAKDGGIPDLVENMRYIKELTGDVSCIGVGTDFDGLTDPFKDCETPAKLDRLVDAMREHFTEQEVDDILYGNSLRALEKGWT